MAGEMTVPLLPCRDIDEIAEFYSMLGFTRSHRQTRPNPYTVVEHEDMQLHFFGMEGFDPAESYGSCLVFVPDTHGLYESFAAGMRAAHGRLLVSGIPRMTRPRIRKNTGRYTGFSVVDPGGNWIRFFAQTEEPEEGAEPDSAAPLARVLENAIVLGESKGDTARAARLLDSGLARHRDSAVTVDLVPVLVYRAELARRAGEEERAGTLLAQVRETPLEEAERKRLADTLADAAEMESELRGG